MHRVVDGYSVLSDGGRWGVRDAKPEALLARLPEAMARVLGADLVGIYVYGSACDETFDAAASDLDCICVTKRALTEAEFAALDRWFAEAAAQEAWLERLQMSFLIESTILEEDPGACLYQFGSLSRSGSDGNPIIWLDHLQRGLVLTGAPPDTFLPEITGEVFNRALVREVGYLREEMCAKVDSHWRDRASYRVYAILTLCRILYSARSGKVAAKARAGAWALEHLPSEWHELIRRALEDGSSGSLEGLSAERICAFIEYAQGTLDSPAPGV